jgi:hypothetical protein
VTHVSGLERLVPGTLELRARVLVQSGWRHPKAVWVLGTYHHASPKHLGRYVDEFAFRLNDGNVARHTLERLASFIDGVAGKRLTYKALIQ